MLSTFCVPIAVTVLLATRRPVRIRDTALIYGDAYNQHAIIIPTRDTDCGIQVG
jgi:hypothetical protein